ncbi:MAG TPA: P-type conjugative transfer ATPase TrbB [Polyangiales bacterium]|nr:P-type conjugative transfer ATPase TrbB [Polyangiales bacterium]
MDETQYLSARLASLLGPVRTLMADDQITDVMINPDGRVFAERIGERIVATDLVFDAAQATALIKNLAFLVGAAKLDERNPELSGRVPDLGWRFQGLLPPVVAAPAISLRKPAQRVYPLEDYVSAGRMTEEQFAFLCEAVAEHRNIVVVGGTGSGKTTLCNALLHEMARVCPEDRVVIIEDTEELQCTCENSVALRATRDVDMHQLLRWTLRLRPDRIVVGEVRGAEALVVLKSWNTGHPGGLTTLHANGAREALDKLEQLAAEGTGGFVPRHEVAAAVDVVVYCERSRGHRRVAQVIQVEGLNGDSKYEWKEIGR